MKKIYIKTWGCQMNHYDSLKIVDLLKIKYNFILTNNSDNADLILLNSCSIRKKAEEKLFNQLGKWKILKINNPNLIICVGGCVSSQKGKYIYKKAPFIDIIFGPQTIHLIPEMINEVKKKKKLVLNIDFLKNEKFKYLPKINFKNKYSDLITIIEGCNKFCTFCIVPYTRGKEISRSYEEILNEINYLSLKGVKEVTLLGQNVNSYRGKKRNGDICKFSELLKSISLISLIERIRFITSHPKEFTDDIINLYYNTPKLINSVHLPLQSGSNKILKLMKRRYTVNKYKLIIKKLRKARPNIHITSDFIIGFPGEDIKDFEKTIKIIKDINFDISFSFIYSPRLGTKAFKMKDNLNIEEKKRRLYILQKYIYNNTIRFSNKMKGEIQKILVEGIYKKNKKKLFGKNEYNRIVVFKGKKNIIGNFINVKINKIYKNLLKGNIINI